MAEIFIKRFRKSSRRSKPDPKMTTFHTEDPELSQNESRLSSRNETMAPSRPYGIVIDKPKNPNCDAKPPLPAKRAQISGTVIRKISAESVKETKSTVENQDVSAQHKSAVEKQDSTVSILSKTKLQKMQSLSVKKAASFHTKTPNFSVEYVRVHGVADGAYKNESKPRGYIFMKNFASFDKRQFAYREGSEMDYDNLLHLFTEMGYKKCSKVCESGHITKQKLFKDLGTFRSMKNDLDSVIFIIMSHGVRDKTFITSDNEEVDLMEIYSMFNNFHCAALKDKPKIFIFHFCRPLTNLPTSPSVANFNSVSATEEIINHRIRIEIDKMRNKLMKEMKILVDDAVKSQLAMITSLGISSPTPSDVSSPLANLPVSDADEEDSERTPIQSDDETETVFRYDGESYHFNIILSNFIDHQRYHLFLFLLYFHQK